MDEVRGKGDNPSALDVYREWAEKGDAFGQAQLGRMYLRGEGVDKDYRLALEWYRKSAVQGNGDAQAHLGHMVEKGLGTEPDYQQALAWYKKSIANGNVHAQVLLGDLYLSGSGVDPSPRKALACYLKAAEQGRDLDSAGLAQLRMGIMYRQGRGVEKDLRKGFACCLKAAKLGNREAQLNVGVMYRDGVGVERDQKKALEWLQKASRSNKSAADSAMGDIYRDGLLVEKNIPEAIQWYAKAAARGDKYAKNELLRLQEGESDSPAKAKARETQRIKADTVPARIRPQPVRLPVDAKPAAVEKSPRKPEQKKPARPGPAARKAFAPRPRFVLFSILALVGALLIAVAAYIRSGPGKVPPVPVLKAMAASAPTRPGLPTPPPETLAPLPESPDHAATVRAPRRTSVKGPMPVTEASPVTARAEPVVPRLRREFRSLDEGQITAMLLAKNLFDAERNPGGDFRHQYELIDVGGLTLIHDRATGMVWTRQRNPVRMSLDKSRQWIESLNRVGYGNIRSWRLPTVEEAASLLQKDTNGRKYFLDDVFGKDVRAIWTGDRLKESESWIVDFQAGMIQRAKSRSRLMALMVSSDPGPSGETSPVREKPATEDAAKADDGVEENAVQAKGSGSASPPWPRN
ncbi:MAG: SEL1-like repeat protein [Candidatus Aminicenantes bacterium]|nr:SEL1-like repeat protein [Candidatus Aminicenantes bacterium]